MTERTNTIYAVATVATQINITDKVFEVITDMISLACQSWVGEYDIAFVPFPAGRDGETQPQLKLYDFEDRAWHTITPLDLALAIQRLFSGEHKNMSKDEALNLIKLFLEYREGDEYPDFDAYDVSNIIQLACFNEVIYG